MEKGILERIEAKLDALSEAFAKAGVTASTVAEAAAPLVQAAPLPPAAQADPKESAPPAPASAPIVEEAATTTPVVDTNVELDTDGVPWDERIHSSNQKRTKGGKGVWQKRKGLPAGKHEEITAELKAKYAGNSATPVSGSVGESAPAATTQASAPETSNSAGAPPPPAGKSTPPPPAAATSAGAPPPPAGKGAETATAAEVPSRRKAIDAINDLTKKYSVNYDAITQYFIDNYNVSGFDQIPPEKFEFVAEDVTAWAATMVDIGTKVADIKKVYVNDVSVIEPYIAQCWANATLDGAPCLNHTDVPFDQLEKVTKPLADLHAQCTAVEG